MIEKGPLLGFTDVHFSFASRKILKGLTFSLLPGDIASLRGPNGSGKTTLLKLAAGRLQPKQGRIARVGDVCYVPTKLDFHETLTIDEEIRYLSSVGSLTEVNLRRSVEQWGLEYDLTTEIGDLSTGQRQRFALAIASSWNPRVVLLDEPTANVDQTGRIHITKWINELRDSGAVVVVATHDSTNSLIENSDVFRTVCIDL